MPNEKTIEQKTEKAELTFGQNLAVQGWPGCFIAEEIVNLKNPNPKRATLGFKNSLENRLTSVDAPIDEWLKVLSELAKKAAGKV
jgi:hypothetical protein